MTVLVTGAAGRIGRHVVDGYLAAGAAVRALVLPGDPGLGHLQSLGVEVATGRLEDRAAVARAADRVDVVCHLAAALTSRGGTDDEFFASNLAGTYALLQALRAYSPDLRRFVYASSDAVYLAGPAAGATYLPIDENHPRQPGSVYGGTKLAAEELSLAFMRTYGIPVSIMRPSATADASELLDETGPFGRRVFVRGMLGHIERQADPGEAGRELLAALRSIDDGRERLYVLADLEGRSSTSTLNDARDAADGMRRIAASDEALGGTFNIGPAGPYAELYLAEYIGERLGLPVSVIRTRHARPDWIISSAKAATVLGYAPTRTVFEMVDEALETRGAKVPLPQEANR